MMASRSVVFAHTSQIKAQARIIPRTKAKERTIKEKARKEFIPNLDFQPRKHPLEKDMARWLVHQPLDWRLLDSRCWQPRWILPTIQHMLFWTLAAHGRLDQEWQSKDSSSMRGIMALRRNSVVVTNLSCLPTARQKPARKVALSFFQRFHHVPPGLMCLRQVMCPSCLFSLSQMKNFGTTIELDPKGDKITCPAFGLCSSPAEHSAMGHCVGIDESCVSANDQVAWATRSPKETCNLCHVRAKTNISSSCTEDEDDQPLVRPASRKEPAKENSDLDTDDEDLLPLVLPEETDFGQSRFGHPDLTNFGQSNFGQSIFGHRGFDPANSGQSQFWPIQFWPIQFWPIQFWPIQFWCHGGPQRVGQTQKKWGPEVVGPWRVGPEGWEPKISRFFSLSRHSFLFFFPSLLVFFVEIWWCLKRRCAQMCTFGVLGLSCETPAAFGAAGVSHDNPRAQTCTFEGPGLQKHHQNSTKRTNKRGRKE